MESSKEYGKRMDKRREEACERVEEISEEKERMESEMLRKHTGQIEQIEGKARLKNEMELQKHQNKERELQNKLRMLSEERERTEKETLRNHTVQIEQMEAKARLKNDMDERVMKEQRMKQEKEINQLRETTRLENEEQKRRWDTKQKEYEFEIDQLKRNYTVQIEQAEAKARSKNEMDERVMKEQRMKQEKEINQLRETTRLENEAQEGRWHKKQEEYESEIDQLKEKARVESAEMERLRKGNEQLKRLREEERLNWERKWSQEVGQHNNVGCVTSSQGGMLVVQDLIGITRRMKQQLEQTLVMETWREYTGLLTHETHFEQVQQVKLTAPEECGEPMMSDRTDVTLERSRYVGICIHGADDELKFAIGFDVNQETPSDGVHVCVTPECVDGMPVDECCEPIVQFTAPGCAVKAETCVSAEHGMSGDVGNRFEVQGEIEIPPGAGFRKGIVISPSASQELRGRAQMRSRRRWHASHTPWTHFRTRGAQQRHRQVSLGHRTSLRTRGVRLAKWDLPVFRELKRRGGGRSPKWGLPDFREPWRKGGGGPRPQLRRDPYEPWRKGGGAM
uniref:trichohyalin-like n=1 Tax=Myxine glutinosa TaxID=7769 RepID=UPI00358E57F7